MIPRSWKNIVRAPRGKILVARDPVQSSRHGLIIMSEHAEDHTMTATGTVIDVHRDSDVWYEIGDQVLLSASGGVQIVFGLGGLEGETELWLFNDGAVKCVFQETASEVAQEKEDIFRHERTRLAQGATTDIEKHVQGEAEALVR